MTKNLFLSVGECMIEMAPLEDGNFRFGIAGDTLNTAWYARALMPQSQWDIAYLTRLGDDPYSHKIRTFLSENNIDTGFITTDEKRRPGLYLVEISNGERSFTYWRDTSAARALADDEENLKAALTAASIIYFSGITLAILQPERRAYLLEAIGDARASGKLTVFDPNIRPRLWEDTDTMRKTLMEAAKVSSISLPSFDDEVTYFADASPEACARRYLESGSDSVVVKNGGGPIWYGNRENLACIDGFEKVQPVDTTGAGDSFNGGFLFTYATTNDLGEAIRAGHRIATKVIGHRGALMDMAEVADDTTS